jgi:uncharacterized protein (DUF169 family)
MIDLKQISSSFRNKLLLNYTPVGFYYSEKKPDGALGFKEKGGGCIMPLIFTSAKGKTVAFDENTTGWPCSAFYLGFSDWIFPGIEKFLSNGPFPGRECERIVKTAEQAESYVKSLRSPEKAKGYAIFKPLEEFTAEEKPEVVIFFANADQLSALTYLLYFDAPQDEDRIVGRFASACAAVTTMPVKYARAGQKKAVWGLHDISVRPKLPKDLMTLAFPLELLIEMWENMDESFLNTSRWEKVADRIPGKEKDPVQNM